MAHPKYRAQRIRLDRGGYDSHGRYYGSGAPLYLVTPSDDEYSEGKMVRAASAAEAKEKAYGYMSAKRKAKMPASKRHTVRGAKKYGSWYVTVYDGWLGGNTVIAQNFASRAAAEWAAAHTKGKSFKTWQFLSEYK